MVEGIDAVKLIQRDACLSVNKIEASNYKSNFFGEPIQFTQMKPMLLRHFSLAFFPSITGNFVIGFTGNTNKLHTVAEYFNSISKK